ncbi:Epoxide hydrolase-like protein [Penicillium ucsense]|uniref:Epoxide hydrolase-like protein n=1 Tax=Penicillium ucsense TaxID=2839758 RepID=A0A8J8W0L0_9EURO|nr:Epoxide hydrolase-like protein [Penicillium ucsense]KAF7735013.1 Epoxide hydrolase-like protein [Penicillium ucsense]
MTNTKTVRVPHLGGIDAAYQMPREYDPSKPTVVLINAFTTSSELYRDQFDDEELAGAVNLIAIELLGHGQTRTERQHWTYWDTAEMNLQVLDALNVDRAFVLGTSQGGWVTVQMALLRPEKIQGIIPMGTSMDSESERSRKLNCWDGPSIVASFVKQWANSEPTSNFEPDDAYCNATIGIGLNEVSPDVQEFWTKTIKANYQGEAGRQRIRMAAINLAERGGLHLRLPDVRCPVLWLHGTRDAVYSLANAEEETQLFTSSPSADLVPIEGGAHFLSASRPREVNAALLQFVKTHQ